MLQPSTRRLLSSLREAMASGSANLPDVLALVAAEMVAEVCSVYAMKPGDLLELRATYGLNPEAVGRTRLRVGEGIVGIVAATGRVLNLPDAQNHPAFAYRPETGEESFASLLAVPIRRAGRTLGVLTVQNRAPRRYSDDEVEVLETVAMLLAEVLAASGTSDGAEEGLASTLPRQFGGTSLAPGLAIGPVVVNGPGPAPRRLLAEKPEEELKRLEAAAETMRRELDELIQASLPEGEEPREVLEAARLFAESGGWMRRVMEAVRGGLTAEAAVHRVAGELRDRMRRIVDPYLRERLADIEDVANRLLAALDGGVGEPVPPGAILLARRLGPAQLLDWHARGIAGVVIEEGSAGGHAAIVARALGLPALGGARGMLDAAESGDQAVLDADEAVLILRPDLEVERAYARAVEAREQRVAGWRALRHAPSVTLDGTAITLMMNAGLPMELCQLEETGAAGIGLFRTEIAMMARGGIADVPDQVALYSRVLDVAGDRPVVFRTLDLGSDKLLPDAPAVEEENPAMGWRSLRVALDRPVLMRRQLRAMLLAANGRPLSIMFPMVATVDEFRAARELLRAEVARISPAPERLSVGTMLEVPALLWQMRDLFQEAQFVSIGSNDLLQFLFAADRGTPALAGRYDMLSPPVLDLLEQVRDRAAEAGVPLSVCGEAASRPIEALVLAALGLTTLSMSATSILPVKAFLAAVDLNVFRPVLQTLRRKAGGCGSLREPILAWAREHGLPA
ncbi:MAG TPA: phosphoenolpyruvate--protein phosphotransferase [Acetobacteraceae bacterium]|nr:phosphoenolpyruvate--protein phosphotransferase [Acetobacteraceae bacterium]